MQWVNTVVLSTILSTAVLQVQGKYYHHMTDKKGIRDFLEGSATTVQLCKCINLLEQCIADLLECC